MIYGYIRVSSDKQTVENQRFEINNFCEREKIEINGSNSRIKVLPLLLVNICGFVILSSMFYYYFVKLLFSFILLHIFF